MDDVRGNEFTEVRREHIIQLGGESNGHMYRDRSGSKGSMHEKQVNKRADYQQLLATVMDTCVMVKRSLSLQHFKNI